MFMDQNFDADSQIFSADLVLCAYKVLWLEYSKVKWKEETKKCLLSCLKVG
jgi:hypothetical protein